MPVVRPRGHNKRSSSSYGPTLILAAFVVLCVVGGWKLTSNNSIKIPLARISSDSNSGRKDKHVFEDNPGDLPDDVVKVDGQIPVRDNDGEEKKPVELPEDSKDSSVDIEKLKEEGSVVEENAKDSELKESLEEAEKQREGESQVSEGGSVAHDQGQEQTGQEGSESQDNKNVEEQESRGDQDVEKEGEKDPLSSSDSRETAEKNEDQISSSESNEKVQDDQQQEDHNVQEDSELEDTRRKNEQGDGGNQDIGKEKDEEQRSSRESNENAQEIEEKGASEDEHDSMSQQQERSEENKKSEDMNKQASEAEELIRQRQEDAGIVQDSSQESHNETSLGGDEHHQEMSSSISSDKPHENVSGSHEFQDETSSALATNKRKKKHKKGSKHKQQTKATVAGSVQEEYQQKEGSNSDTMVEDKLSKPEKDDSESRGQSIKASKESTEPENTWSSQASESKHQKDRHSDDKNDTDQQSWQLCNVTAGPDYIPCLDNVEALKHVRITGHYEHRERHCPEKPPTCLVPLPNGYKTPVQWPASRDKIWYNNVPHPMLAGVKGHQNWVKVMGEFLTFPGGGTQFIHGALHYIQYVEESESKIAWGKHTRVILDVGCGVASFGGFLFEKDVLAMSFAPKDEHEAQVQFALERGIPAISAVMGSQRLPYPSNVFDLLHCARCRVPWHREGGMLLLELNRVLRPGGYFVWSATPVYQNLEEDVAIWKDMESLTKSMCWKLVSITKDKLNSIGAAIYQKPSSNECYDQRTENSPPMCENDDDPNAAWYIPLQACIHRLPEKAAERGSHWPESWPLRLQTPPYWLDNSQKGIYGKPAQEDFAADYEQWKELVKESYMDKLGFNWSSIRNVLDMRSVYGGFAAALRDLKLWVMNIVNVDSADTLPIIYERGLLGMYHDWCESFSTYPRTYDLLHADNLFSRLKTRCKTIVPAVVEVDRIVRPGGKLIIRDEPDTIKEVENLLKSLQWKVLSSLSKDQYHILSAEKSFWRPNNYAASS